MAIYRGVGGAGDATNDATSQSIIATQAAIEAAESAIQAAASAVSASNSATAASNSASAASTSATNASNFADDAADYATAAASALDEFTDLYLGAKTTNPSIDNDGNALQTGALYFNTVANEFRVYTGFEWQVITVGAVGDSVITQRFSGDGNTVAFTLSTEPFSENSTFVYINGAYQQKNTYNVSGLTLTFSEAPPSGADNIEVLTITMVDIDNITASIINIADAGGYYASSKVEGALQEAATFTQSGTGAVLRTKTDKLKETVSVKDFGAVGDNVADDYMAIQSALDYAGTTGAAVWFPPGKYRLTAGLLMPTLRGVELIGTGQGREGVSPLPVELWFEHVGSPAIQIRGSAQAITGILVRCSGARQAAAYDGVSHGVLIEAVDAVSTYVSDSLLENVDVQGHPGHGIVYSGANFMNKANGIAVRDCKGHAFYISDGTVTGRTNKGRPGGFIVDHLRTYKNGGHDIVVTPLPETEYAYRVFFLDGDLSSRDGMPAIPAGLKIANATCIFNGENIHCINLAFGGRVSGTPTYAGLHASGRTHQYSTCRFVGVVGVASTEVGSLGTTDDIVIDSPYVTNDSTISPAVVIGSSVGTVTLIARNNNGTGVKRIVIPFTTGYKQGIFENVNGLQVPLIECIADSEASSRVIRDSNVCGFEVERTGTGAATGKLQAASNEIQVGSTTDNDTSVMRNGIVRIKAKSNTINLVSLPTSASGLTIGDLWNDGGIVKVV